MSDNKMSKKEKINDFIYRLQALGLKVLAKIFLFMGVRLSSFLVGTIFMIVGPFTPPTFTAIKNIKMAMPELNFFQRLKIIIGMWNNLGRDMAEFVGFHSKEFDKISRFICMDKESINCLKEMQLDSEGAIIFAAHFGNWEIFSQIPTRFNIPISAIYRAMNNIYADKIVLKFREKEGIEMIPKGQKGVIKLARSLKSGRKVLMLVDQRLSSGIEVPFFNIPAKTSDSVATFALKYGYKVYSGVVFRRSFSSYFDLRIQSFDVINTGNLEEDIRATTIKINQKIEEWIRTKPEQWFWVHRRWKK